MQDHVIINIGAMEVMLVKESDHCAISIAAPDVWEGFSNFTKFLQSLPAKCDQIEFENKLQPLIDEIKNTLALKLMSWPGCSIDNEKTDFFEARGVSFEHVLEVVEQLSTDRNLRKLSTAKALKALIENGKSPELSEKRFRKSAHALIHDKLQKILGEQVPIALYEEALIRDLWKISKGELLTANEKGFQKKLLEDVVMPKQSLDVLRQKTYNSIEDFINEIPSRPQSENIEELSKTILIDSMRKQLAALVAHYFAENKQDRKLAR